MKIIHFECLIDVGDFSTTQEWRRLRLQIVRAIRRIHWPADSNKFILHDQSGKKRGQGSGVKAIKLACMIQLESSGWELESRPNVTSRTKAGPIDATCAVQGRLFALEWETGNISSSHRALNKMALGLIQETLIGGVLIVPTREMAYYLTDRIGNYQELEPYFPLWRALSSRVNNGLLAIVAVEHDGTSHDAPRLPKGTDGRALA